MASPQFAYPSFAPPPSAPATPEKPKKWLTTPVKVALGVFVGVTVLALASRAASRRRYSPQAIQQVESLVRQANQYSNMAAQDTHPLFGFMHTTHALACAHAARQTMDPDDVRQLTGVGINDLCHVLETKQHEFMQRISAAAPQLTLPHGVAPPQHVPAAI